MPDRAAPGPHLPGDPGDDPPWVHVDAHEPNLQVPAGDGDVLVLTPAGRRHNLSVAELRSLPYTSVPNCLIVSTGHGVSGPFTFGGVRLIDVLDHLLREDATADAGAGWAGIWQYIDLVSADGFGTRLTPADLDETNLAGAAAAADGSVAGGGVGSRPVLLAYMLDGAPLARGQGLVRLIVPSETDDALRQVKWLATITIV